MYYQYLARGNVLPFYSFIYQKSVPIYETKSGSLGGQQR